MNCPDENVLTAFADRTLAPAERPAVEGHLDECSQCFAILAEMARAPSQPETLSHDSLTVGYARGPATEDVTLVRDALVGRYTVLDILGQGGMGTVYLAHDPELDRRVALKVLRRAGLGPRSGPRLTDEARIMARLAHPNIVTVFDAGEADGRTYLAMELLDGGTLTEWLRAEKRSPGAIVDALLAAGRALAAAHAAGVVHRDFKPANVLLDRRGRVAVADFGIAAWFSGESAGDAGAPPRPRAITGTPAYMSPEQRRGDDVGPPSDQFSFAVTMYEALCEKRPFAGAAPGAKGELGVADMSAVPSALRGALRRALALDPGGRFPSMSDLVEALERARRPSKGRTAGVVAAIAALAVVAVGLVGALTRARDRERERGEVVLATSAPPDAAAAPLVSGVSGGRTVVVALPLENRTGDASYDGVVEAVMTTLLSSSRHLDASLAASLRPLGPALLADAGEADDEAIVRAVRDREDRPVILVRGALTSGNERDAITIGLTATDAASHRVVADLAGTTPSRDALVATVAALTSRLRAAIGDAVAADEGPPPRLSSSLAALHDWAGGQNAIIAGQSEAAVPILERAVREDPDFALAHAALGRAYSNTQNDPAAKREIDLALRSPEGFSQRSRLLLLADSYLTEGRTSESISVDEQLLQLWPADAAAEIAMVATALRGREWPLALELARRAVAHHPGSSVSRANVLVALLANGKFAEASTEGAVLLDSTDRPPLLAYVFVALAFAVQGDRQRALATYDQLAAVDEELADEGRADLAMYEGRLEDAERLLQPHITAAIAGGDPSDARTEYRSLAICRLLRGDRAGAVAAARAGVGDGGEAERGAIELQYSLASTLVASGSEKEAVRLAREWNDHPSATWRAYAKVLVGDVALHRGHAAAAIESYQAARRLRDEWRVGERIGQAYLAQRDWEHAAAELETCWERRGEVVITEVPSLQYLAPLAEALRQARDHVDAGSSHVRTP